MTAFDDWVGGTIVLDTPLYGNGAHIHEHLLALGLTVEQRITDAANGTYATLKSRLDAEAQILRQESHNLIGRWLTLATNEDLAVGAPSLAAVQELSNEVDARIIGQDIRPQVSYYWYQYRCLNRRDRPVCDCFWE